MFLLITVCCSTLLICLICYIYLITYLDDELIPNSILYKDLNENSTFLNGGRTSGHIIESFSFMITIFICACMIVLYLIFHTLFNIQSNTNKISVINIDYISHELNENVILVHNKEMNKPIKIKFNLVREFIPSKRNFLTMVNGKIIDRDSYYEIIYNNEPNPATKEISVYISEDVLKNIKYEIPGA